MRRDLTTSLLAVALMTVVLGLLYPLAITGIAQALFPGNANGSKLTVDGRVVGSRLIGQEFRGNAYFHSRPSATGYSGDVTFFGNLGPNSREARDQTRADLRAYLARERPNNATVPVDAATQSASGVDPDISVANAEIQARRVAAARGLSPARVQELISEHTDGRFLGLIGEPGVNVLELNLALDEEAPRG